MKYGCDIVVHYSTGAARHVIETLDSNRKGDADSDKTIGIHLNQFHRVCDSTGRHRETYSMCRVAPNLEET